MTDVVIDSNAIVGGDWFMRGAAAKVLMSQAEAELVRVIIPELVVQEIVAGYRRAAQRSRDKIERESGDLSRLGVDFSADPVDLDAAARLYEATFRQTLVTHAISIPEIPELPIQDLVTRALQRRRPFSESGSGFRDALLWSTVLDVMARSAFGFVALVTNDKRAFATDKTRGRELHADLRTELGGLGRDPDDLMLFPDLESYVRDHITEDVELHARVVVIVETERAQLENNIAEAIAGEDLELADAIGDGRIEGVRDVEEIHVQGTGWVEGQEQDLAVVELLVSVDVDMNINAFRPDDESPIWTIAHTVLELPVIATYDATDDALGNMSPELPEIRVAEIFG